MQHQQDKDRIAELEEQLTLKHTLATSLENIVELSAVGILILDSKKQVVFVNNNACMMLGLKKHELQGKLFGMPIVSGKFIEISFQREDDSFGKAEMQVTKSTYLGQSVHIISLHDITDRKKLERHEVQLQVFDTQRCSISEFLEITIEKAVQLTGSEIGFLTLLDETFSLESANHICSKNVFEQCAIDDQISMFHNTHIQGPWEEAVRNREPIVINDFTIPSSMKEGYPAEHIPLNRFMTIPVLEKDRVVALIGVANKKEPYGEIDVQNIKLLIKNALGILRRKVAEEEKSKLIHNLGERVKELRCLYAITDLLANEKFSLEEVFQEVVNRIPPSWQYPDITCAQIQINSKTYNTGNFRRSNWGQAQNIIVNSKEAGTLEVYYLDERPDEFEGPFLREERDLLADIADRLSKKIEQKGAQESKANLEVRLQQVQKMESIGTLAGGIAHDFNNILSIILGYADMAKIDAPPDSTISQDLDAILQAGHRAKNLVQQILAFSHQAQSERIPIKIQPLIKEAVKMLRSSIPTTITITEDIDPKCGNILADPTHVHQILMNLGTNAYHAMELTGGELSVVLGTTFVGIDDKKTLSHVIPGKYVELTVSDTGSGINPDVINKIFDPYFTTKEIGKGTGMGLAIIHGIIKDYGGTITVEAQLGKGATFHVYFPLTEPKASLKIEKSEDIPIGKERILFIEDEELLAEMSKNMLERLGYRVVKKCNSFEALKTFQDAPDEFDLIITDQTMPGITGFELSQQMLKIRPDISIILCTGYSSIVDENSAKVLGIKEFAFKPLIREVIATLIRKVLDASREQ